MRKPLLLLLLLLPGYFLYAQKPLTNSRRSSFYTYIYRLNDEAFLQFANSQQKSIKDEFLNDEVAKYPTDHPQDIQLPPGNYLRVTAAENKLQYKLIQKYSANFLLFNNNVDLTFLLLDNDGNEITDALVYFGKRTVVYDPLTINYHTKNSKKDTLLKVSYKGVSNFFRLNYDKPNKPMVYQEPKKNGFLFNLWASIKWPFKQLFHKKEEQEQGYYPGFIVFNKPKYRPGDTVKFKAFVVQPKTKLPITEQRIAVRLMPFYGGEGKIIGYVNAYRKGAFEYQFKLTDSLGLTLDRNYNIRLESANNKHYDTSTLTGYNSQIDARKKWIIYQTGFFMYQDYQLQANKLDIRIDNNYNIQSPGSPTPIYIKATDDNGLNVLDGRLKITLTMTDISDYNTNITHVFIPDTLWQHQQLLDPVGETKIIIPDSIFPKAKISYRAEISLLNSNNESKTETRYMQWDYHDKKIKYTVDNDTVTINYLVAGKPGKASGILTAVGRREDTLSIAHINLPAKFPVNKNVSFYKLNVDGLEDHIYMPYDYSSVFSYRSADSLHIYVDNPTQKKIWYAIYKGNKLFEQGVTTNLNYNKPFRYNGDVKLIISQLTSGRIQSSQQSVKYSDKNINIAIKQPASVYPGQQADIEVNVKDNKGKPVANADLTAYSITSKFDYYQPPTVPYLGKTYAFQRVLSKMFDVKFNPMGALKLNWQYWSKNMGLDSIQYYRFTHPDSVYKIEEPAPDNVTQIAPFVVKDGDIIPVHILFIDDKPVYFSQTTDLHRYSFPVSSGIHYLRLRVADQMVRLDRVNVAKGKKLILSINADSLKNKAALFKAMPDSLTTYEAELINPYLISVVPNFDTNLASLEQKNRVFLLNYKPDNSRYNYNYRQNDILTGPFDGSTIMLNVKDKYSREFKGEPNFSYYFEPGLIKQKSLFRRYPFNTKLASITGDKDYRQYALTTKEVDSIWASYKFDRTGSFYYASNSAANGGTLVTKLGKLEDGRSPTVTNTIVYKNGDARFIQIHPSNQSGFFYGLAAGTYRVFYLLKGGSYYVQENMAIKAHGINYYYTGVITPHEPDSVSLKIAKILEEQAGKQYVNRTDVADEIRWLFNEKYFENDIYKNVRTGKDEVSGYIFDSVTKEPLTGTTVGIPGRGLVQADINGFFRLKAPKNKVLVFSIVGYLPQTMKIVPGRMLKIALVASPATLNETVIRGYVKRTREETTGSSYIITGKEVQDVRVGYGNQSLQGKVPGLNIQNNEPNVNVATLNRINLLYANPLAAKMIYLIDGTEANKDAFDKLPKNLITDISILKADAAIAIYGAKAANGAVIVTTKKIIAGADDPVVQTLRHNFSDYAYWQPKLTTDAQGNAKFKVTYPDDITSWRTFVFGMTDNKQSGFAEALVKSYKPVSANFVSPLFALQGDSFSVLGKVLNYTNDTLSLNRKFSYNGKQSADGNITLTSSRIDTFKLVADGNKDSLTFEYAIKRSNGYFDGERRQIPLFPLGSLETKGNFDVLERDTTIRLKFDPNLKQATVRAEVSALPVLLDETEHLRNYEYFCNEQLASKLKALLAEKQIRTYLGQAFKWDKDINDIIKKLMDSRNQEGTWGWWKDTPEELWISNHVIEALLTADSRGFKVQINKQQLIDYLVYRSTFYNGAEKLTNIQLLKKLDSKADLPGFVREYEKALSPKYPQSQVEKYRLMYVRQLVGMPIVIDSLLKHMNRTMFGNVYWGKKAYSFFNNSIQESLLAYHILKTDGGHANLLAKLRNYFMEQRNDGYWRNTYESAEILETILPDMLVGGQKPSPAKLVISGDKNETITQFPYTATVGPNTELTIAKSGGMPVYITAYQKFWNLEPKKVSGDFAVDTWFEKGSDKITRVKGGEAITLYAEVNVKADADFVMIEVPIPAGCSYDGKDQGYYYGGEVHREYFKNKVSIFCRKLTVGKYKYAIKLMPRYSGTYHLNPAKAEMMYYPVFYGREGMKQFNID